MSLREIKQAAQRSLEDGAPRDAVAGEVVSAVLAVRIDDRQELVTVSLAGGELRLSSTDEVLDSPFVQVARAALAGAELGDVSATPSSSSAGQLSVAPVPADSMPPRAQALTDLLTAIVRLGVHHAAGAPAVVEALERLEKEAGVKPAVGVSRFVGRLKRALSRQDVTTTARLLDGAARLARDLTNSSPGEAQQRVATFFGGQSAYSSDPLVDRRFFEIGRERVAGLERASIERRYLLDLGDGQIYGESLRVGGSGSMGPCPRILSAGLSEVSRGITPPAIRLLQYVVSGSLGTDTLSVLGGYAVRRFSALAEMYRVALKQAPGLAEPVILIAPQRFGGSDGATPIDSDGLPLPLAAADAPGIVQAVTPHARRGAISLLSGRLLDHEGTLMLLPLAALIDRDGTRSWWRLR